MPAKEPSKDLPKDFIDALKQYEPKPQSDRHGKQFNIFKDLPSEFKARHRGEPIGTLQANMPEIAERLFQICYLEVLREIGLLDNNGNFVDDEGTPIPIGNDLDTVLDLLNDDPNLKKVVQKLILNMVGPAYLSIWAKLPSAINTAIDALFAEAGAEAVELYARKHSVSYLLRSETRKNIRKILIRGLNERMGGRGADRKERKKKTSRPQMGHRELVKTAIREMFSAGQPQDTEVKKRVARWLNITDRTLRTWEELGKWTLRQLVREVQRENSGNRKSRATF
jgi:hypothetical protein